MNRFAAGFPGFSRVAVAALMLGAAPVLGPAPVAAQGGQFAAVAYVNDKAVTQYEVDQRQRFLTLLRQPGDLQKEALQGVIDDRLRVWAAAQVGLKLVPADITRGMEEFASRANLPLEDFVKALNQGGVSAETFRDFVTAQITWRELIRAKYVPTVKISDAEVDRALAAMDHKPAVRVLMSELVIPVEGDPADELAEAERLRDSINGEAAFAQAAQQYSASRTAGRGGKLDWIPVANLAPDMQRQILSLSPGEVAPPMSVPNAVVILQLRAIADAEGGTSGEQTVDFARFTIADGPDAPAQIAAIKSKVDTCNDLYAAVDGTAVQREEKSPGQIPADIALELAKLDPGEVSTALRSGGGRVFLMLCARNPVAKDSPSREDIRQQLISQRLSKLADVYMEQLRSEALIRTP